jgi:DNA-binding NarL/FixJ family response regulator
VQIQGRTAVLVDEHPLWLDAVEQVMATVPVEVVGKATSLEDASRLTEELRPDLVVVETLMSSAVQSGLNWLADTRNRFPDVAVIVLSTSDDSGDIASALALGAVAYVVKKAHPDDLAVAVRQVYEHSIYLPRVVEGGAELAVEERVSGSDLTRRELEILRLMSEGLSNAELARMLWVTEQTVKFHLSNIYRKLGVANRTEASRWAQLNGLLPTEPLLTEPLRASRA